MNHTEKVNRIKKYRMLYGCSIKEAHRAILGNPNIVLPNEVSTKVFVVINKDTGKFKTQRRVFYEECWSDKLSKAYQYKTVRLAEQAMSNYNQEKERQKEPPARYVIVPLQLNLTSLV